MSAEKFDVSSKAFKIDPFPTFRRMREAGAVVRVKLPFIGRTWMPTTYEWVDRVLRDHKTFVQDPRNAGKRSYAGVRWWMPRMLRVLLKNMLAKDEPDHRRLRGLVEKAFVRASVEEMRQPVVDLVESQLDLLEREADGGVVDVTRHFARPLPLAVICEMLGLPAEDRSRFAAWAEPLSNVESLFGFWRAFRGMFKVNDYLKGTIEECRRNPRPGLLSALVEVEQDGESLDDEELLSMAFLLLFAGHETTVHLLDGAIVTLLEHPEQLDRLRGDWSKVDLAVDEVLRYFSPIQVTKPRYASRDVEIDGVTIPRGDFLMPLLASANCDPAAFDDPETFDVFRTPNPHVSFGRGIHVCLGMKLAKTEVEIALALLFTRFPNLSLAKPRADLDWMQRPGTRGVRSLPVRLS